MWAALKLFFSTNAVKVMEWAVILGSAAGAVLTIFNAGKKSEQVKELTAVNKEVGVANEVKDANSTLPDGAAGDKLREDWSR